MENNSKIEGYSFLNDYRYERKFQVSKMSVQGVETVIKNHPAFFKEIFHERYINNIYFDTQNLTYYYNNSFGKSQRTKYRIRWYGNLEDEVKNPILEIKIKNALVGTKESYKLENFNLNSGNLLNAVLESLKKSDLPENVTEQMKALVPSLGNRYKRKYFMDFSKKFRITVDTEIEYYNVSNNAIFFNDKFIERNSTVVELKYNQENNMGASAISSQFPFRMTKNSKYVNGIECFNQVSL